jgi:hypothetical protein
MLRLRRLSHVEQRLPRNATHLKGERRLASPQTSRLLGPARAMGGSGDQSSEVGQRRSRGGGFAQDGPNGTDTRPLIAVVRGLRADGAPAAGLGGEELLEASRQPASLALWSCPGSVDSRRLGFGGSQAGHGIPALRSYGNA